ncbi:heme-binding protein [uncultured Tateyamaria sp.]|uniref:GlcG/HbpS family heme-binding protein n=1 Tax=uncultured Tateyamaria sp. TaxID=455651 RepID=UPI00262A10AA|nr:heme-binding protein [uncultured Tateyamaria sp.]
MLTLKRLDIQDAHALIAGARAKAQEIGVPMCIAVTDESGNLIAFERMDGGKITSIGLAIDKSFTAAGVQKGTDVLGEVNQPGMPAHGISSTLGGRMVTVAGGLPVFADGVVVGGIGISSGSPAQDLQVAQAAVAAFSNDKMLEE